MCTQQNHCDIVSASVRRKNLQLLHPPCSRKPSLALAAGQGRRGVQEGKILGYHDINLHVSFLLCVQEVGSGAMRLLAPVSLGMPACSPEEIEEIGLAPPEETPPTTTNAATTSSFFPLSPSLFLTLSAYLWETTKGFCTLEQSEEASEGSGV